MRARYTQANAGVRAVTAKALVNGCSNKVVNIASTKLMKKVFSFVIPGSRFALPGMTRAVINLTPGS
jgi:hypothetical protein